MAALIAVILVMLVYYKRSGINATLALVLNALILTTGTYLLMQWGLINKPFVNVPWTTPPIIGHYLVSGGDWRAAVWGVLSIVIAMAVYYPFAKVAERQRLKAEAAGTAHE